MAIQSAAGVRRRAPRKHRHRSGRDAVLRESPGGSGRKLRGRRRLRSAARNGQSPDSTAQANEYRCPRGEPLRSEWRAFKKPRSHITQADTIIYRSSQRACADCPLKPRCCPNTPMRKVSRSLYEKSRAVARKVADTAAYRQSRKDLKKVEVLFAHLKRILKLDRLRLRGRRGARDEFLLAATAQNLRRMAKRWAQTTMIEPIAAT